jgi:hypothetical protein
LILEEVRAKLRRTLRIITTLVKIFRENGSTATRGKGNNNQAKVGPERSATKVKVTIGVVIVLSMSQKNVEAKPLDQLTKLKYTRRTE